MRSSLAPAIRDHLADYLRGDLTLRAFDEWFVAATWHVEQTGDQQTIDLTDEIILRPAEYSHGDCTEAEL
jgi:hypothetical protein